jgi:DNA polymerase elongation subunit (family B)
VDKLEEGCSDDKERDNFRAGSSLLADSDTQILADELNTKINDDEDVENRALYTTELDSSKVKSKKDTDEVDLHDAVDFDEMKDASWTFNPDMEYYHGWSEGKNIILLRRDAATGKRIKEVHPFDWYFFITRADYDKVPREKWDWLCRNYANKVEPDPRYPDLYVRVYVDNDIPKINRKKIFRKVGDPDYGQHWAVPFFLGERPHAIRWPRDRDRWTDVHRTINWCDRKNVTALEADLNPKQRFLTDFDIKITPKFHVGFFDIETDDSVGGFDQKEQNRILSIAWEGDRFEKDPADWGFVILKEETDEAEKEMLLQFKRRCLKKYDVISAWNGGGFDFPVLIYRFHYHKIFIDWRYHLFADPLPVFKRHYVRAGGDAISYSLDSIGEKVLKMNKIDWRTTFRERHPGVVPKFINLYRYDKELLKEYNIHDCRILRKLEEFTGFVMIEQLFCRIANGFPNDWNISTKVDQLLLKKGFKEGFHFPTRYWSPSKPEQYEGAYVFSPVVGMHRNVAAFDFKSLYPSMVSAFNISPETIIKKEDRKNFKSEEMCSIPSFDSDVLDKDGNIIGTERKGGTTFRLDQHGFISQMFARTLERRSKYTDLQKKRLDAVGTTQDDLFLLYYRLAYSFKRLGLSFYGDIGNSRSRFYDTELAESITLSGQFFIKLTSKYATECGMAPLYGDTDSIYIQLAPTEKEWDNDEDRIKELTEIGEQFVEYCQERYLKILKEQNCNLEWNKVILEFEDTFDRIFFIKKKRYAGRMLCHKGGKTDHVEVKGLEVMRSDCSGMTRKLQQAVLDGVLMTKMTSDEMMEKIIKPEFDRCANGELTDDEVTIGKGISKDPDRYKSKLLHVRLAEYIRDHGREFYIGMKIMFVVTSTKPKLDGVTREDYEADDNITYASEYYWDRVIYPASKRILEVVYPDKDWTRFLITTTKRRRVLVERYKKWLKDPKKVQKAIDQIKENKNKLLGEPELIELRRAPRVRIVDTR